jgi:hypothetical protein
MYYFLIPPLAVLIAQLVISGDAADSLLLGRGGGNFPSNITTGS